MTPTGNIGTIVGALTLLLSAGAALRGWNERRYTHRVRQEVAYRFVVDMATNHLPHVYESLRLIGNKLGVELADVPPIRFVEFEEQAHDETTSVGH